MSNDNDVRLRVSWSSESEDEPGYVEELRMTADQLEPGRPTPAYFKDDPADMTAPDEDGRLTEVHDLRGPREDDNAA